MDNKPITEYSDLELAKVQSQVYQDLMRVQQNLIAINGEIERRVPSCPKEEGND